MCFGFYGFGLAFGGEVSISSAGTSISGAGGASIGVGGDVVVIAVVIAIVIASSLPLSFFFLGVLFFFLVWVWGFRGRITTGSLDDGSRRKLVSRLEKSNVDRFP